MSRVGRNKAQPGEIIDRSAAVEFKSDGRKIRAQQGDTIASALYAAGTTTFSRSFKYHRPRGLLCAAGHCPNCLVTVDGEPNVRACTRPVEPGMKVEHQNAWPSLRWDFLSILDWFHWLMPVGFYYKALHRPKWLWLLAGGIIRRVGGLGSIDIHNVPETNYHHRSQHADVAVVGGGPAGIAAALAAAEEVSRVVLIDDQPQLGGYLRFDQQTYDSVPGYQGKTGVEIAHAMAQSVAKSDSIEVMNNATVFGLYQDNLLAILAGDWRITLRAKRVVIATGAHEVPLLFENNDLPGIMLASAARRLIGLYGIRLGSNAVVATETDQGYQTALELLDAGVNVAAVVDAAVEGVRPGLSASLSARGIRVLQGHRVVKATGRGRVKGVMVASVDGALPVRTEKIPCDLLCVSGGYQPVDALLQQVGGRSSFDGSIGESVPASLPLGVYAAGDVTGAHSLVTQLTQGRLAGSSAAVESSSAPTTLGATDSPVVTADAAGTPNPPLNETQDGSRTFLCFCEDVSVKDVAFAIDEGFEDIQILKRYTTVSMGPCQGKMCGKALAALCANHTGRSIDEIGGTTARPPYQPVPLAALAGPSHMPIKRSPMDHIHRDLGASMVESGLWQRPDNYGSAHDEAIAVRQWVGIIDVSTLGKLDVQGEDVPALLDLLYTNTFSDLRVGRVRYGLMCLDNGAILDDGTVTRLAQDRYFVTTTSGNADAIEEWFNWWMAGSSPCAHVTNVTGAYGAVNVAGPRARETLSKLTDIDLATDKFRYMRSRQGEVAGVPCLLIRIGFVGEAGWELHFPAEHGEHLWESIMEAGREFDISPFGLEAQRILRLEKGHIIVGQDTDAISNPLETRSEWAVHLNKDDFVGRVAITGAAERGIKQKLVGFIMENGMVPEDGVPVVSEGRPVGRVTSARLSPTLDKGFGLAWVPSHLAEEGAQIMVLINQREQTARVTMQPVYDPDGARLRS
ncbi:MAG: (2Fe-2S)-binding protein [Chloroflexi bacterium]|nr:(2Fe-2S)-binding protein [Chloroflexota bacterium]